MLPLGAPRALLSVALAVARGVDERTLVRRARGGDAEAFATLVEAHQSWLVNLLIALVGRRADAEDVAQGTLVKAFYALPRFRGDAAFRTWLRRIATNEAFNWHRRQRDVLVTGERPPEPSVASGYAALEARDTLMVVLDSLSYPYREVLVLRHVEELSMQQIAEQAGIGLSAAKMRLKRAREQFMEVHRGLEIVDEAG